MPRLVGALFATAVVGAAIAAAGVPAPAQVPKRGGVLRVAEASDPVGFDTLGKKKAPVYTELALAYTHNRLLKYAPAGGRERPGGGLDPAHADDVRHHAQEGRALPRQAARQREGADLGGREVHFRAAGQVARGPVVPDARAGHDARPLHGPLRALGALLVVRRQTWRRRRSTSIQGGRQADRRRKRRLHLGQDRDRHRPVRARGVPRSTAWSSSVTPTTSRPASRTSTASSCTRSPTRPARSPPCVTASSISSRPDGARACPTSWSGGTGHSRRQGDPPRTVPEQRERHRPAGSEAVERRARAPGRVDGGRPRQAHPRDVHRGRGTVLEPIPVTSKYFTPLERLGRSAAWYRYDVAAAREAAGRRRSRTACRCG